MIENFPIRKYFEKFHGVTITSTLNHPYIKPPMPIKHHSRTSKKMQSFKNKENTVFQKLKETPLQLLAKK